MRKKIERVLSAVCCSFLVLSLTACGSSGSTSSSSAAPSSNAPAASGGSSGVDHTRAILFKSELRLTREADISGEGISQTERV